ncbi:MAG: hypothetical protein ABIP97_09435 [Chthoniobacterales bacterium]
MDTLKGLIIHGMENSGNQDNENRAWEMLEKGRQPNISPFFSRNVVREARKTKQGPTGLIGFYKLTWVRIGMPVAACLMLVIGVMTWKPMQYLSHSTTTMDTAVDFDTVTNLDLLVSNDEGNLWTDTSSF